MISQSVFNMKGWYLKKRWKIVIYSRSSFKQLMKNLIKSPTFFLLTTITKFKISSDNASLEISNLKYSSSTVLEGFAPVFLNTSFNVICHSLSLLLNIYLKYVVFLDCWKPCSIAPIFNSGDRKNIANYRAIVKQCTFAKIFDKKYFEYKTFSAC